MKADDILALKVDTIRSDWIEEDWRYCGLCQEYVGSTQDAGHTLRECFEELLSRTRVLLDRVENLESKS